MYSCEPFPAGTGGKEEGCFARRADGGGGAW